MYTMKNRRSWKTKDIIIVTVFVILILATILYCLQKGISDVGELIFYCAFTMLAFVEFINLCRYANWTICVPSFYLKANEEQQKKQISQYMKQYYQNDILYVQNYDRQRMNFFMSQLGLTQSNYDKIRLDIINLRGMQLKDIEDAKKKMQKVLTCPDVVIDQNRYNSSDVTYKIVTYFINIVDFMFLPDYADEIASIFTMHVTDNINYEKIDRIIVPHDSNFLLGFELNKRLNKPVVNMRKDKGRVLLTQCWDGILNEGDKIIIIHDVLVTAKQIKDAINKLPKTCEILGLFCLISRKEFKGKETLQEKGIPVYSLLEIDDNDIEDLLSSSS